MSRKFIIEVQETPEGDLFIEFPQEIVDELGLIEGDVMRYDIGDDGESFIIRKDDTGA
jgi:bifunctional DNA-binding transcriptional regulator/antitoxin component of YhaV-PrlF toxin-antitoxin module